MSSRFLADEQRARYGRYVGDPSEEQLARQPSPRRHRLRTGGADARCSESSRLAVQLGTVRFHCTFLDNPTRTPSAVITTVARPLGEVSTSSLGPYRDGWQR